MLAIIVAGAVIFGVSLSLVYYPQIVLGFTPLQTDLAVLPLCLGIMISATLSTSVLVARLGAYVSCAVLLGIDAVVTALMYRGRQHAAVSTGQSAGHM